MQTLDIFSKIYHPQINTMEVYLYFILHEKKNQYTSWAKLHLGLQRIYFFPLHRKFRIFNFPACCDLYDIRVHKSI